MTARARACSRRDWSADASCGHRLQTAPSRSALRSDCPGQVTRPMKSGLAPHRRLELPLASCFEGLLKAAMCPPIPVVILQPLLKDSSAIWPAIKLEPRASTPAAGFESLLKREYSKCSIGAGMRSTD